MRPAENHFPGRNTRPVKGFLLVTDFSMPYRKAAEPCPAQDNKCATGAERKR